jgi:hypothetical protein
MSDQMQQPENQTPDPGRQPSWAEERARRREERRQWHEQKHAWREQRRIERGGQPSGIVGGAILISIGLFALLSQFVHVDLGEYFLLFLAFIFLLAGVLSRRFGLINPGGILAGIGAGAALVQGPFANVSDPARGGVFMLAFACGWLLITAASFLYGRVMLWPLIPGAFIGLFGLALTAGQAGLGILTVIGQGWPIVLIALGVYLVFRRKALEK